MSGRSFKVGQRVDVTGKDVKGVIAYQGMTAFAPGAWIGLILDEPKGKNNGSIQGQQYFTCEKNHGMFVRANQVVPLDADGNPIEMTSSTEEKPRSRLSGGPSSVGSSNRDHQPLRTPGQAPKPTAIRRKSPVKSSIVRKQQPPNSMVTSMSSSRQSLAGSRQSLLGSRSHLASPATERPPAAPSMIPSVTASSHIPVQQSSVDRPDSKRSNMSPPASSLASKRSSFVETGFVETLRPQFIPGQPMTSPSPSLSSEDKLLTLQLQQENEDLRGQIRDLTEKMETIKQRRTEDKEYIRELEKIKTPFEQLQEFKQRIIEANSQLQRDLQRARQETKDAIEAKDNHAEEMSELAENVELITLDKEMAEEKAETLQLELDQAKERIEELSLDLEIIKTEMQNKFNSASNIPGEESKVAATFEYKQLEQQNSRLRETLVRLRDLTAHDKHEIQKLNKELETRKSETTELQKIKEKLTTRIDEMETQFVDLQEQVDAALGAEEMVEQLAEKKMELEDRIKALEDEVTELEALEEVHEQLVESNHELELDLREELDMAHAAKREALRERDATLETIVDRDQTIIKFRELVQKLNDQMVEMREKSEVSTKTVKENIADTIDFKQMFAESKAFTRAIDLQLRQIEINQAQEHVRLLTAYMPETFMTRGSDHDAILVILLISRLVYKSGIIVNQARERFPALTNVDRAAVVQGHDVNQFEFRSRLLYNVNNLQSVMHQFLFNLNSCKSETLLKVGSSLPEMIAQEKVIDGVVELLKANQLDENSSTENLEKTVSFFNAMFSVLMSTENLMNETQLIRDCTSAIGASCDAISTDATIIQLLIAGGDETSDSGLLMQYINQNVESVRQQVKLIKRRLPHDASVTKCNLSAKTIQNLRQIVENFSKLMQLMCSAAKQVISTVTIDGVDSKDASVSHAKLWEILSEKCENVYEQDDRGPAQNIRTVLSEANTDMSQLAQYLLDNEYEIMSASNKEEKPIAPIVQRAQFVKKQLEETKTLTATLENREAEIRQLKMAAKLKLNELSEMQIRKDLAEKKLSVLQHDYDMNVEKLQRKLEETTQLLKKKEKEYEETMDHLQSDIDSLESEKGALRDKLKGYSHKKGGDLKSTTAFDITSTSPYIEQELQLLKKAFVEERNERLKLQAQEYQKILSGLEPIHVPKTRDRRIEELDQKLTEVKHEWILSMARGATFPSSSGSTNGKPVNVKRMLQEQEVQQRMLRSEIQVKAALAASDVLSEYLERKPHRASKGDFHKFPTVELKKALAQ